MWPKSCIMRQGSPKNLNEWRCTGIQMTAGHNQVSVPLRATAVLLLSTQSQIKIFFWRSLRTTTMPWCRPRPSVRLTSVSDWTVWQYFVTFCKEVIYRKLSMKVKFVKIDSVTFVLYLRESVSFSLLFPYLLTDFGEIRYRKYPTTTVQILSTSHDNRHREHHSLIPGANGILLNFLYFCQLSTKCSIYVH